MRTTEDILVVLANGIVFILLLPFQPCLTCQNSLKKLPVICKSPVSEATFKGLGVGMFAEVGDNF
jgi:hypothetical protein